MEYARFLVATNSGVVWHIIYDYGDRGDDVIAALCGAKPENGKGWSHWTKEVVGKRRTYTCKVCLKKEEE